MFPIDLLTHSQLEKTGVVQKWITWIKTSWYKVFVPFNSLCIFHSLLIITWLIFLIMIILNIVPSLHTKFCQFSRNMYFCLLKTSKFWNIFIFATLVGGSVVFLSLIYRKLSHDITNFHKNYCTMWGKRLILSTAQEIWFTVKYFSLNTTKTAISWGFGHIYWRILNAKLHYLCSNWEKSSRALVHCILIFTFCQI